MSTSRFMFAVNVFVCMLNAQTFAQFPATISPPMAVNGNAGSDSGADFFPGIASDGNGHWVAVWESNENVNGNGTDSDILVARSTDNGATWTPPAALNTTAMTDNRADHVPQIATDEQGHWIAVWQSDRVVGLATDRDIFLARSTDNGATWTDPAALNLKAGLDSNSNADPQIVTDRQGNWVAVWESTESIDGSGHDGDILVSRSTDNGETWTRPALLNSNAVNDSGQDEKPKIATDGQGHWVAVWQSDENFGGAGTDFDILTAHSSDNGATWTPPAPLNGNAATDTANDHDPSIATDGLGHWVAVWHTAGVGIDFDIFVATSADNGATWTAPATLNTNAANDNSDDVEARIVTDGKGNWVACWVTEDPMGHDGDILVAYSSDNGTTWSSPVTLNTNAAADTGNDNHPAIATDGRGNWICVWASDDTLAGTLGSDFDILTARFALPDCNHNGIGDGQDITGETSTDCNGNGIPDDCETDSDGDGVIEFCDNCPTIANADQADSNNDGVGDACTPAAACGACGSGAPSTLLGVALLMRGARRRPLRNIRQLNESEDRP